MTPIFLRVIVLGTSTSMYQTPREWLGVDTAPRRALVEFFIDFHNVYNVPPSSTYVASKSGMFRGLDEDFEGTNLGV